MIAHRHLLATRPQATCGPGTSRALLWACAVLWAVGLSLWPTPATARDMTGKAGLGAMVNTVGMPFMTLRYWRTRVATELLGGWAERAKGTAAPDVLRSSQLRLGLGALYRMADHPKASLAVGVRPWLQVDYATREVTPEAATTPIEQTDASFSWGFELPLQAEMFLTDHFSVQASVALAFGLNSAPGGGFDPLSRRADDDSVLLTLGGGYSGGLGLSYYF